MTTATKSNAERTKYVMALAEVIFANKAKANAWLRAPNLMLDGHNPVQLLRTDEGELRVVQALHRIDHGIFA